MDFSHITALVKEAGQLVFHEELRQKVDVKGEADFVTAIDLGISAFLKEHLGKIDASVGFFSEEEQGTLTDPCWILDPIDGTTNLIYGYGLSSVSLALYQNGAVRYGVVYNPFNGECFTAEEGKGAWLGNKYLRVSMRPMRKALIEFGAGSTHKENADANFSLVKEVFKQCIDIRRICSSALDLCYIASGRIDGYFEKILKPWDIAAGALILTEAGGMITDYDGAPLQLAEATSVIAGNGIVNPVLQEIIQKYRG